MARTCGASGRRYKYIATLKDVNGKVIFTGKFKTANEICESCSIPHSTLTKILAGRLAIGKKWSGWSFENIPKM